MKLIAIILKEISSSLSIYEKENFPIKSNEKFAMGEKINGKKISFQNLKVVEFLPKLFFLSLYIVAYNLFIISWANVCNFGSTPICRLLYDREDGKKEW